MQIQTEAEREREWNMTLFSIKIKASGNIFNAMLENGWYINVSYNW